MFGSSMREGRDGQGSILLPRRLFFPASHRPAELFYPRLLMAALKLIRPLINGHTVEEEVR